MDPFVPFGGQHWLGLALSLGLGAALVWAVRRAGSRRLDRATRWALAAAAAGGELFLLVWWLAHGAPLARLLPLHMCDIAVVLAPVVLLTGHRLCYELLYFWGLSAAPVALLTPNVTVGFPAVHCVCFFALHGLIVASALYATVVMRLRPTLRSLLRAWLLANVFAALLIPLNGALGTNYMFVSHKPDTPSLLDVMGPWPWYILVGSLVGLVAMALCYLPFFVIDHSGRVARASRTRTTDEGR